MGIATQQVGVEGEENLIDIFGELLENFGQISCLRRYESGSQEGKDVKAKAYFLKKNSFLGTVGENNLKWFFEIKNYKSKLTADKLLAKAFEVTSSNESIDCFCLFSPYVDVSGKWEDNLTETKVLSLPNFPFKIVLWTPSYRIKERLKCFPEIYKKIYHEEVDITEDESKIALDIWINEIINFSKEGKQIRQTYIEKFKGDSPIWIPESIEEARKKIKECEGNLLDDDLKASSLQQKLDCGGVNTPQELIKAQRLRILSEGTRRKYKKTNESLFSRLNALRYQLESFCLNLEKEVSKKNISNEAVIFIDNFSKEIAKFKEEYKDQEMIKKLPDFYLDGQMYDITGECILMRSKKWLEKTKSLEETK